MTSLLAVLALPCVFWTLGPDTAPALKAAGLERVCVPAEAADSWRTTGLEVKAVDPAEIAAREALPAPGLLVQPGLASPTRSPWITTNGWRFIRHAGGRYRYILPAGRAVLAAAEALAYGADVLLQIDPADLPAVGRLLASVDRLPRAEWPPEADFAVVDDGSPESGELMNLLVRRNLLFDRVTADGSPAGGSLVVRLGTPAYTREEAADPSALALKIRRTLTDDRRTLRLYGSEVVIGRLTADEGHARLQLLNYGGRTIEGLRVRVRGEYAVVRTWAAGGGTLDLTDKTATAGATEFSLPTLETYAVVDLDRVAH
jgi:hypothetical protein